MIRTFFSRDFLRFGIVGASGFLVDTATVYGLRHWIGLYGAMVVAYLTAATWNWGLNRAWTFSHIEHGARHAQWGRFLAVNLLGLLLNRGTAMALASNSAWLHARPVWPLAAGTAAGMGANFLMSRRFVFR